MKKYESLNCKVRYFYDIFQNVTSVSYFMQVRSLTQRLNVEDAGHPGFPSSRLLSHLAASRNNSPSGFWSNMYSQQGDPLSRWSIIRRKRLCVPLW